MVQWMCTIAVPFRQPVSGWGVYFSYVSWGVKVYWICTIVVPFGQPMSNLMSILLLSELG